MDWNAIYPGPEEPTAEQLLRLRIPSDVGAIEPLDL